MTQPSILVAEDESIIGIDLCNTVAEAGFAADGPFPDLCSAMLAFQQHKPDLAILDVQLGDGAVYPFAEKLMAEDIPVIFHSGQADAQDIADRFPSACTLEKPCPPTAMIAAVQNQLSS